jgi:HEAT repeat protein
MWKVLLLLLALGVVFVILLKVLERWSGQAKFSPRQRREIKEGEFGEERSQEAELEDRVDSLIADLTGPDTARAEQAAAKLQMMGPKVLGRLEVELLRTERGRRQHELAVVARRLEDTLASFGPAAIRTCLNALSTDKGSFEVFRGVRVVLTAIGEGAARPVLDAIPWLSEEGLYVRALLLLKALGPGATSALLRGIESSDGRARELCVDLLLDYARFFPAAIHERVRDAFVPASPSRRGIAASAEVRQALLLALGRVGIEAEDLPAVAKALLDEDGRVRREAWMLLPPVPEAAERVTGLGLDSDPNVAAAQIYALDRMGLPLPPGELAGQVAVARAGVRARQGDEAAFAELDRSLTEGPLESRREAAEALAYADGEIAGRILARGLLQTPVPVLATVALALGRTRSQAAVGPLFDLWEERGGNAIRRGIARLGDLAVPKLLEYVSRRNPRLMEPAALVLGEQGAASRGPLLSLLRECHPDDPALFAVEIALEVQGKEAVDDLLVLLDHERVHVREVAAWVLGQIGDLRAVEPLLAHIDRLEDRYPVLDFVRHGPAEVRAAARRFIEQHPDHPDIEALRQAAG